MFHVHLRLHGLEVVGKAGLGLSAHSLPAPLPETIKLLVHIVRLLSKPVQSIKAASAIGDQSAPKPEELVIDN